LLAAQAFIPPTERNEVAGFDFVGDNDAIRAEVIHRLNATAGYRKLFAKRFPTVKAGTPITYGMFAQAISEFEFTLTFANAPIDRYARGDLGALTVAEKKGALLFFGAARCSVCHSAAGQSNEMFSDFQEHVLGVPQIAPALTNAPFDGPGLNEDFGLEQITGNPADRYKFRTSPLRNVALQPTFMHNGAFRRLEDAIRHHLNVTDSVLHYSSASQDLPADLSGPLGPMVPVLARLDPILSTPIVLTESQFDQLLAFVRHGLLDPRATPERLRRLVPHTLPSGRPMLVFEFP
jgi:cytochrome c peroxidase